MTLLVIAAAAAPGLAYAGLVALLDRSRRPLWPLWAAALLAGIGAAFAAGGVNDLLGVHLDGQGPPLLVPVLAAPVVEEIAKAAMLLAVALLVPGAVRDVPAGITTGALVGIGFAMRENVTYFTLAALAGGPEGLVRSVYLRGLLQGLNHAAFTAAAGAGLGWTAGASTTRGRRLAPLLGLAAAILLHVVWNGLVAVTITDLLCGAATPGGVCRATPEATTLFLRVPLLVGAFLGPALVTLLVIGTLARRRRHTA